MTATVHEVARPADIDAAIAAAMAAPLGELVGSSEETTDSGTFTTTVTQIGSVTFTQVSGYTYMIECCIHLVSDGSDTYQGTLWENSTAGTERASRRCDSRTSNQARPNVLRVRYRYVAGASGSKTFVVSGHRIAGLGNVWRDAGTDHRQLFTVTLWKKP